MVCRWQGALIDAVDVRERARAAMLDKKMGGQRVAYTRFPRHVQVSRGEDVKAEVALGSDGCR